MKGIKFYFLILLAFLFIPNVYAGCSSKEQIELNTDLSNLKIVSEIIDDQHINIVFYNITKNLQIVYDDPVTSLEENITFYDTTNGKYVLERTSENIEEYSFEIQSTNANCYGNILTTKNITKPKYNEFSSLDICKNSELSNHTYCQKYISQDIKKSRVEVEQTLNDFLQMKVKGKITQKVEEGEKITIKQIVIWASIVVLIGGVISVLLLIKKKRSEL